MTRLFVITATLAAVATVAFSGTAWKWGSVTTHKTGRHPITLADTDGWTWDGSTTLNITTGWTWDGATTTASGA